LPALVIVGVLLFVQPSLRFNPRIAGHGLSEPCLPAGVEPAGS
jgi:hypothetical protein